MKIRIITDSSSDISQVEAGKLGIGIAPLQIDFEGKIYTDGVNLSQEEFYDKLINSKKLPKTSQPSPEVFVELFEEAKKANEIVICITISSTFSGTYNSANIAKGIVDYENIYLVDSKTASAGLKMLVMKAYEMKEEKTALEIVSFLEEEKKKIRIIAGVDTLEYLHKGGRLSKTAMVLGTLLKLKPVLDVYDGKITPVGKSRGVVGAIGIIKEYILKHPVDEEKATYFGYTYNDETCQKLMRNIEQTTKVSDNILHIGTVIGTHTGPNVYAFFYYTK